MICTNIFWRAISVNCMKLSNNPTALNSKGTNSQLDPFTYMSITKPNSANACLVLSYAIVYKWG